MSYKQDMAIGDKDQTDDRPVGLFGPYDITERAAVFKIEEANIGNNEHIPFFLDLEPNK